MILRSLVGSPAAAKAEVTDAARRRDSSRFAPAAPVESANPTTSMPRTRQGFDALAAAVGAIDLEAGSRRGFEPRLHHVDPNLRIDGHVNPVDVAASV